MQFGPRISSICVLITVTIALASTANDVGPFADLTINHAVLLSLVFSVTSAVEYLALFLAAVEAKEQRRA